MQDLFPGQSDLRPAGLRLQQLFADVGFGVTNAVLRKRGLFSCVRTAPRDTRRVQLHETRTLDLPEQQRSQCRLHRLCHIRLWAVFCRVEALRGLLCQNLLLVEAPYVF